MSLFICPLCQSPLQSADDTWRCDGSLHPKQTAHPFDVARQGYVNLLPVQQKKSKAPGDSQQSIDARKRFLNAGHYQPLNDLICQKMAALLTAKKAIPDQKDKPINWLDIGCGEGYYTQAMAQTGMDVLIAADISKPAVVELAKTSKALGRLWYQPVKDDSATEVIKAAAIYPLVTSAAHLATMREALFDDVREHDSEKFLQELAPYFQLLETNHVSTKLSLSAEELADLMTMTPYAYRARSDKRQALLAEVAAQPFATEAKFVIYILQKTAVQ